MDQAAIFHLLNSIIILAMPLGLGFVLTRLWKVSWRIWFIGAVVFILSQVGHIPFNALATLVLNKTSLVFWPKNAQTLFNVIFLGLSAGIFEEFARYAMFRWWIKHDRDWRSAVLAGAGHGGAEAIYVGLLSLATFFQLAAYRNVDVSGIFPAGQLELARQQIAAYWSMSWVMSLLPALERYLTIPIQICFSIIVIQAFLRNRFAWVLVAVLYHALIDGSVVYIASRWGALPSEAALAGFTIASILVIIALRPPKLEADHSENRVEEISSTPDLTGILKPVEETPENLDASRFQ